MHSRLEAVRMTMAGVILLAMAAPLLAVDAAKWDAVPSVEFSKITPDDFRDDELDLPYYLAKFRDIASAIVETGPDRGFIDTVVWRGAKDNKPYNARVMESHLTLAWFYTQRRPWNPYYNSPAVRQRLAAMLTRLCDMQNDDGRYSEYGPKQWNLPATAFATKFLGETITLLKNSDAKIDPEVMQRVIEADRKAILATLEIEDLYRHGKSYTNQFANVFAGAAAYLALFPDAKIKQLMEKRFADAAKDFQSPCGYFYEANGPDFGYTLGTHHNNVHVTYFYLHDTPIGDGILEADAKWNQWLSYNLLRQPDGSTFVANRGVETRQQHAAFDREDGNLAEKNPGARAFATSKEERQRNIAQARKKLAQEWGAAKLTRASGLPAGGSSPFSPYVFLQRRMPDYLPSDKERDEAIAKLPYLARERFVQQRVDSREPTAVYTFIRRPTYYAIFNSGKPITPQQRLGLGLIWLPKLGTVFQTQTNTENASWGTSAADAKSSYEATDGVRPTFTIGDKSIDARPGSNRDLPDGEMSVSYPLGQRGHKTLRFTDNTIEVKVDHPGAFVEQIPLAVAGEVFAFEPSFASFEQVRVEYPRNDKSSVSRRDDRFLFGTTRIYVIKLPASDSLTYTLRFAP